jgi:hypothetical protein
MSLFQYLEGVHSRSMIIHKKIKLKMKKLARNNPKKLE